jgi:hypothetical protein
VVITPTLRPLMVERVASLAMVSVFPAPGGPISMNGRGARPSGSGWKVKMLSSAADSASIGSPVS